MLSYDDCLKYSAQEHFCPHCKSKLTCCETPPFHIGDGLGWGAEVMFICLNDECSVFTKGWEHIEAQYGHNGSYRYFLLPGEAKGDFVMVGSSEAFTGSIIDPEILKAQNERHLREKEYIKQLDTCVEEKRLEPVLALILDESAGHNGRLRAISLLPELNDISCIDAIRNHKFDASKIEHAINSTLITLLRNNFKKECPYCAEIIKLQAKVCMHCNKEFKANLSL
jgi:hypothetical protein